MVALYLTASPQEQSKFSHLESWIIEDARDRARWMENAVNPADFGGMNIGQREIQIEARAQCMAGNPAACFDQ
jgi:hypothetical protein